VPWALVAEARRWNLASVPVEELSQAGEGRHFARRRLGGDAGAHLSGCSVYELEPGERAFSYHYELLREEWLLVVSGAPTVRTPRGDVRVGPGDVLCFPVGPAGAHQVRNDSDGPVRFLLFSNLAATYPTVQPDSDKLHVTDGEVRRIVRASPQLDYWDGEP
jgi:uncharacterized cupin superfamily protein